MPAFSLAMELGLVQDSPYKLLLHSLNHEHNATNYDRHASLFDKWSREYVHGLFVQDLQDISKVLKILRERYVQFPLMFGKSAINILSNLLCKPLLEKKANERKSIKAQDNMSKLLKEIFLFYENSVKECDIKVEVLRCISQLIISNSTNVTDMKLLADLNARQVADRSWVNNVLSQSGLFQSLSEVFKQVIVGFDEYLVGHNIIRAENLIESKSRNNFDDNIINSAISEGDDFDDDGSGTAIAVLNDVGTDGIPEMESVPRLVKELLIFFREIASNDEQIASKLFEYSLSDPLLRLIRITITLRETFVSDGVDLFWTILDAHIHLTSSGSSNNSSSSSFLEKESRMFKYDAINLDVAVSELTRALNYRLEESSSTKDKDNRNDILIVLSLLLRIPVLPPASDNPPSLMSLFLKYNTLTLFIAYSVMAETSIHAVALPPAWKPVKSHIDNTTESDFEFKRLLWIAISSILTYVVKVRSDFATITGCTDTNDIDSDNIPFEYTEALNAIVTSPILSLMLAYLDREPSSNAASAALVATGATNFSFEKSSVAGVNTAMKSMTLSGTKKTNKGDAEDFNSIINSAYMNRLASYQLQEIRMQAINFIAMNVIKSTEILEEFINLQGLERILKLVEKYSLSDQSEHAAILLPCLGLLQECFQFSVETKSLLLGSPIISVLLWVVEKNPDQTLRTLACHVLSLLCSYGITRIALPSPAAVTTSPSVHDSEAPSSARFTSYTYQQHFEKEGGIQLCLSLLEAYNDPRPAVVGAKAGLTSSNHFCVPPLPNVDPTTQSTISLIKINDRALPELDEEASMFWVALVTTLWKAVNQNHRSLMVFGQCAGLDALFNLLETSSSFTFRILLLRFLSDLITIDVSVVENGVQKSSKMLKELKSSRKYLLSIFHVWRSGKTFRHAIHLLLHCWLDEEVRLGVTRLNGVLRDVYYPLGVSHIPIIAPTASGGGEGTTDMDAADPASPSSSSPNKSITVNKLNAAILNSRRTQSVGTISREIQQEALRLTDIRGLIANLLLVSGVFDNNINQTSKVDVDDQKWQRSIYDEEWKDQALVYIDHETNYSNYHLNYSELQVLSIARRYNVLKQMYGWIDVIKQLQLVGVKPVEADQLLIDFHYNFCLKVSTLVSEEQNEILRKYQEIQLEEENKLHRYILNQKENDKKSEALKKHPYARNHDVTIMKAKKTKTLVNDNYVAPPPEEGDGALDPNAITFSYDDLADDSSLLV